MTDRSIHSIATQMKHFLRVALLLAAMGPWSDLLAPPAWAGSRDTGRADLLFVFGDMFMTDVKMGRAWKRVLDQEGITYTSTRWSVFDVSDLEKVKVLILVDFIGTAGMAGRLTGPDKARLDNIQEWVKAGGGLLFCQADGQVHTPLRGLFEVGDRFGAQILFETMEDKGTSKPVGTRRLECFKATVRGPREIVGDTKQVWCPPTTLSIEAGVLPVQLTKEWTVTLEGTATSRSEPAVSGLGFIDQRKRNEGFKGNAPIAGVRNYGKGRVAYCGVNSHFLGFDCDEFNGDRLVVLTDGIDGDKSDGLKWLLNTIAWLKQPSDASKGPVTFNRVPVPDEKEFKFKQRLYKGLIGPRTNRSSGNSSAAEYVQQAKQAGLDYLIFLEEYAKLKDRAYEELIADCERLTDEAIVVFPGVTVVDELGNHLFACGYGLELISPLAFNDKKELLIHPRSIHFGTNVVSILTWFVSLCGFETLAGFYHFEKNAVPYYDARGSTGMGVILTEQGRVVERNLDAYAEEQENGQDRYPLAITLMRDAREIQSGQYYVNALEAHGFRQLLKMTSFKAWCSVNWAQSEDQWPDAGHVFLSNGPEVVMTRTTSDIDGWSPIDGCPADGPASEAVGLFHPAFNRWAVTIRAHSATGVREVKIYDGTRLLRRFKVNPPQEEYSVTVTTTQERQKYVWAQVLDTKGREAVSRDISSKTHIMQEVQCGDRFNQLFYSCQRRADGSPCLLTYGGPAAIPDKGPWNGRLAPAGYWVFDTQLGIEKLGMHDGSPEQHPTAFMIPALIPKDQGLPERNPGDSWSHDLVKGVEGPPHVHPRRVIASGNVLIADRIMDGVFPAGRPVISVWNTLWSTKPSEYLSTTARTTIYNPQ